MIYQRIQHWRLRPLFALLGAGAALTLSVVLFVGLNGMRVMHDFNGIVETVGHAEVAFKTQVQEWNNLLHRGHNPADLETYQRAFAERRQRVIDLLEHLRSVLADDPAAQQQLDQVAALLDRVNGAYDRALPRLDFSRPESARAVDSSVRGLDRPVDVALEQLIEYIKTVEDGTYRNGMVTSLAVSAIAVLMFATFGILVLRMLVSGIEALRSKTAALAAGELDARVSVPGSNELGQLAQAFNAMAGKLQDNEARNQAQLAALREAADIRDRVEVLRRHVEQVSRGDLRQAVGMRGDDELTSLGGHLDVMTANLKRMAEQIRSLSNSISTSIAESSGAINTQTAAAAQQASAISETTSTLAEIRATSNQTLEKAQALGKAAEQARAQGELGVRDVKEAVAGNMAIRDRMDGIAQMILSLAEQVHQIGEINKAVTGLAQQSKMLALNASIEAAKAGEAGKGFAVVAAEVKDLAEQSQHSTAQVQKILQDIRQATDRAVMAAEEGAKGVDQGVLVVEKTGETVQQLMQTIRETATASQQIVAAVRQVDVGIDQVGDAMQNINQATSQFVTSTRQSDDANTQLSRTAHALLEAVQVYRT